MSNEFHDTMRKKARQWTSAGGDGAIKNPEGDSARLCDKNSSRRVWREG